MIQPFFNYACNTWYPSLNKNLKTHLQAAQNKCIRSCLKLGNRKSITVKEFQKINWLLIHKMFHQCTLSWIFKFHVKKAPDYREEMFSLGEYNGISTGYSYLKMKLSHRKINQGLRALSYCPLLRNNLDKSFKTSASLNEFKQNIKDSYF